MLFALENSVAAFKNEVRADWVLASVHSLVPFFLFGQKYYGAMFRGRARDFITILIYSTLDITPNVRCIVPIEVNNRLWLRVVGSD